MLSIESPTIYQSSKCFVTYGRMGHINPKQVSHKGKPWASLMRQEFIHKVDVVVPAQCFEAVHQRLLMARSAPIFCRVVMTLGQILDGAFFTDYIKRGHILMLSQGRNTDDRVFTVRDGTLTMYLDKEAYEQAGLVGKPHGVKGRRGLKPRWIVTYDLHNPAMLHGKKGFDRVLYACKNVFNQPLIWLFCNVGPLPSQPDPIQSFSPTYMTSNPVVTQDVEATIPSLQVPKEMQRNWDRTLLEEFTTETYEWISLLKLESPRIGPGDKMDPYLSSYVVPGDPNLVSATRVCKIRWQGLLSPKWVCEVLVEILSSLPSDQWFSLSSSTFAEGFTGSCAEVTLLRPHQCAGEYILWEINSKG